MANWNPSLSLFNEANSLNVVKEKLAGSLIHIEFAHNISKVYLY